MTVRPTGKRIGWVAQEDARIIRRAKRVFTVNNTEADRDMLWRDGQNGYEWVRGLYYDATDGYQIEV